MPLLPLAPPLLAPAFSDVLREVEGSVAGEPFDVRTRRLKRTFEERLVQSGPGARERTLAAYSLGRGVWPMLWRLDRAQDDPASLTADPDALRARFLCYGDAWPRARQNEALRRIGGAKIDRRIQVWYALFPYMEGPSLKGIDAVGRIAARFPDRWEPLLVRHGFVRTLYRDWTFSGFPRRVRIPLALHLAVNRDVDRAYRIVRGLYGPGDAWNVTSKQELNLARYRAGQRDLQFDSSLRPSPLALSTISPLRTSTARAP